MSWIRADDETLSDGLGSVVSNCYESLSDKEKKQAMIDSYNAYSLEVNADKWSCMSMISYDLTTFESKSSSGSKENKGKSDPERGETVTDFKSANSEAKLIYTTLVSKCADLIADGKQSQISYGAFFGPTLISKLDSSDALQRAVYQAMTDDGCYSGYVSWEIGPHYKVSFARYYTDDRKIIGQYPDPITSEDQIEYTNIPNFVGLEFVAVKNAYGRYLIFNVKEEWSSTVQKGFIIEQSVVNKKVKSGFILDVVVSKGERTVKVPDMTQKTLSVALSELKDSGFIPITVEQTDPSGQISEGMVIRTAPEAGSVIAAGSQVTVYVSKGNDAASVKVPNVIGMTQEKAIKLLKENKLNAAIVEVKQKDNKGKVIEQNYPEGAFVDKGTEITIYVSTG